MVVRLKAQSKKCSCCDSKGIDQRNAKGGHRARLFVYRLPVSATGSYTFTGFLDEHC